MAGLSSRETPVDDRQPAQISSPGSTTPRDVTGPDKPTQMTTRRWRAFALLVVAYFMTIVDLTIVNVALPTIGLKLHFAQSDLQWLVTAYGLTFGGFLLLGGRAADLLGRRRLLMVGLAIFSAASLAAGLATSDTFLIVMRGLQGFGAAVVLPAALSIVMNMFAEGAERNKALGIWGAVGAMGATVGVLAGGLLTRYIGWQYIFFLNAPIGAAALALAPRVVPRAGYAPIGVGTTPSEQCRSPLRWWSSSTPSRRRRRWAGAPPRPWLCSPWRLLCSSPSSSSRRGSRHLCCRCPSSD